MINTFNAENILIIHYHLLPGGVTEVIRYSVLAMLLHIPEIRTITIASGSGEGSAEFRESIVQAVNDTGLSGKLSVSILPELYYTDYLPEIRRADTAAQQAMEKLLAVRFKDADLWVIHNHTIGKNPVFTGAVVSLIASHPEIRFILQIHDFPECSRFRNYAGIPDALRSVMYPVGNNVRYALINPRDREYLIHAGIPENMAVLLENPIPTFSEPIQNPAFGRKDLNSAFKKYPGYLPDRAVMLYPVRSIRRKNVLEAALIASALEPPANLIVTLPGISDSEKAYSDLVEKAFKKGHVLGAFGTGTDPGSPPLADIAAASDVIVSSSVQEGFGYFFLNSVCWKKPIAARGLDTMSGMHDIFSRFPHYFYSSVRVPLSERTRRETFRDYRRFLEMYTALSGSDSIQNILEEVREILSGDLVDFSYLHPGTQFEYLSSLTVPGVRDSIQACNKELIRAVKALIETDIRTEEPSTLRRYGIEAFSERFRNLCSSFGDSGSIGAAAGKNPLNASSRSISGNLLAVFLRPDRIRLLFHG